MSCKKLALGLDIGVSSVGWGIIDIDNSTIIDAGVRLFPEADKSENEKRRSFRSSRRLKRRRTNRKDDLIAILKNNGLFDNSLIVNPYIARKKGLTDKLSNLELTAALIQICKHRGSSLETVEDEDVSDEELTKSILAENDKLIKSGKYVCEIQLDRLENNKKIRGTENNFRSVDYEKELDCILSNQDINEEIKKQIINCILDVVVLMKDLAALNLKLYMEESITMMEQ